MPASENDRRNQQAPVLENPSMPDHDRTVDDGMHAAVPNEIREQQNESNMSNTVEEDLAPPDQEFEQVLFSGQSANQGRIPEDPNNWNTSDPEKGYQEMDPENRGDSLPDIMDRIQH